MANHPSAEKRNRQSSKKRVFNHYFGKTTRNAIKKLRNTNEKGEAAEFLPKVSSMLDKMVKRNQIHKNKAANLKSSLAKHVNSL